MYGQAREAHNLADWVRLPTLPRADGEVVTRQLANLSLRQFESDSALNAGVAQAEAKAIERFTCNKQAAGSNPAISSRGGLECTGSHQF